MLAAWKALGPDERLAVLPTLGRVGGPAVLEIVAEAIADKDPQRHAAGTAAIYLWPNASVAPRLIALCETRPMQISGCWPCGR